MTRSDALRALLAKVEAGDRLGREEFNKVFRRTTTIDAAYGAFLGILDAAKELHEAVLPGWIVSSIRQLEARDIWYVVLCQPMGDDWDKWQPYPSVEAVSADPASAWLAAILKALIATEDN